MSSTHEAAGPGALKGPMLFVAAILLASANFIAVLDMTIANVSVPTIAGSLGISASQGTWIITSYAVAEAIIVPLTGWLAGRFGPVRVFTSAMLLFGLFSAFCGLAHSLGFLVLGRVLQGLSGGLLMPLSQTMLLRIFPKEKTNVAMALWAMTTLIAPVLGPIVGGSICDSFSWPLIFFINVPIALVCSPLLFQMLKPYEEAPRAAPIDKVGLGLLILFVGALQIMLDTGKENAWFESTQIWVLALVAGIGFVLFVIWELTERHPIVDLRIFRHRGFTASVITLALGYGAMFGSNVLTPLWLQSYMGYTSTWAGMTMAWTGVLAVVMAPVVGQRMAKVDPRRIVFVGLAWIAFIMWQRTALTNDVTYWQIALPLLLMGIGMPLFIVPLTALSLGSVEPEETASAAGLQNFLRTMSGAVATSLVQTAWEDKTNAVHADLSGLTDRHGEAMHALTASGLGQNEALVSIDHLVQGQSVIMATNQIMLIVTMAFALAAFVIWLAPKPRRAVDMSQAGH